MDLDSNPIVWAFVAGVVVGITVGVLLDALLVVCG